MSPAIETPPTFIRKVSTAETASIPSEVSLTAHGKAVSPADNSLFDHCAGLYAFFREKIFRDDTDRIIQALWPSGRPAGGTKLIELGCGPGFYSSGLAARFPQLSVLGVDRSARQLHCAREKKWDLGLENCRFECDDVLDLSHRDQSFDVLIAARLFTVLPNRERAVSEMYRILRPNGRCLVAEPRYVFWASLPLFALWLLASLTHLSNGFREPRKATVLKRGAFKALFSTQPWREVKVWHDGRYQYALCEKG